jgi:hypothetical protein
VGVGEAELCATATRIEMRASSANNVEEDRKV